MSDPEYQGRLQTVILTFRLTALALVVTLMSLHVRSVRVFRWEQSVSGGVLVTYCISLLGLALCAGAHKCGGQTFQAYLSGSGAVLLAVNAGTIWHRWKNVDDLTHVIAELLETMGVPLEKHVKLKMILSAMASVAFIADLALLAILRKTIK